jgi:hypothetical protein
MSDATPLRIVADPTADEEIRAEVVGLLEETLEQAKRGEITEILLILKHPGTDEWSDRSTSTQHLTEWIGKLEVTKQSWILQFLNRETRR